VRDEQTDDGGTITIRLQFAVGECPQCGAATADATCPACGSAVTQPEPDPATRARTQAFAPLLARAHELVESFSAFREGHIPVTTRQVVAVVVDADLPSRALALIEFAHRANDLDLEDTSAIGSTTRQAVVRVLDEVERMRNEARMVAAFSPPEQLEELSTLLAHLAAHGAAVVEATVEMLAAPTLLAANAACARLQDSLTPPREAARIEELLASAPRRVDRDDLDARASLALGIDGHYTDDFGVLDPAKIFAAASAESSPFAALAAGAGRYLSHLLDTPPEDLPASAAFLSLCAVQLAALDRPYEPHRQAEMVRETLTSAHAADPAALADALEIYDEHQGNAFGAATRVRRDLRRLAAGEVEDRVAQIETVVGIYKRLAEGPFRASARLLLAARATAEGRPPTEPSLLLGDIDGLLDGWHSELGMSLRGAADRDLRNAEAHELYRVDHANLDVVIDSRRIPPDKLEAAVERLAATVAAIDAAILCYRIDAGGPLPSPKWLTRGDHPRAVEMILQTVASAYGAELLSVRLNDDTLCLRLSDSSKCDQPTAMSTLMAAAPVVEAATVLRAETGAGPVAEVGLDVIGEFKKAPEDEQDLAAIAIWFDVWRRANPDAVADALADALALQARVLINIAGPGLAATPLSQPLLRTFARRIRRIARFAAANSAGSKPTLTTPVADLRALRDASQAAARNPRHDTLAAMLAPLNRLSEWADSQPMERPRQSGLS